MQKRSHRLQSLQDKKKPCKKNLCKWAQDSERIRNEIEERHGKTKELRQQIHEESRKPKEKETVRERTREPQKKIARKRAPENLTALGSR